MRNLLILILLLATTSLVAQVDKDSIGLRADFSTRTGAVPPGAGTYGLLGFFIDSDALGFTVSDIVVDETYFEDINNYIYIIKSVSGTSPLTLGLDAYGHSMSPSFGTGTIYKPSKNHGLPLFTGSENDKSKAGKMSRLVYATDSLLNATTSLNTIFSGGTFSSASTNTLFENASGSYSTRFQSPSNSGYMGIYSDTTDSNFLGLKWSTLRGTFEIGENLTEFQMTSDSDIRFKTNNSLDRFYFDTNFDTDNNNTTALAVDPVTKELEQFTLTSISTITPLYRGNQYLTGDRLISGGYAYDLYMDSLLYASINANEVVISDSATTIANWYSTTNKYLKKNSGYFRWNSLGLDNVAIRNTNGSDAINEVLLADNAATLQSYYKAVSGVSTGGSSVSTSATNINIVHGDTINASISSIYVGKHVGIVGSDSLVLSSTGPIYVDGLMPFNEALTVGLAVDTSTNRLYLKTTTAGSMSYDDFSSGTVTTSVTRYGGAATTLTNPSTGTYRFTANSTAYLEAIDFQGNNANLSSGELTIIIDNSSNSRDRLFTAQIIGLSSNGYVDVIATGTNYTETVTVGNITTIVFSNMSGFGTAGYKIMLR